MPTLLLSPRYTPDSIALWHAAIDEGWDVERLRSFRPPEGLSVIEPVLCEEPLFASLAAAKLGVELLEAPLDWLAGLPARYLARELRASTLDGARAETRVRFIKPADDKSFPARVYRSGAALPPLPFLDGSTPVLIAEPVRFLSEYRCFVREREVTTLSPYLRGGELARDRHGSWVAPEAELEEALGFARAVCADPEVELPPATVLDVGLIEGRGWAVVEANPCWGAGICGCEPSQILPVLRRACVPRASLSRDDARWRVERSTALV